MGELEKMPDLVDVAAALEVGEAVIAGTAGSDLLVDYPAVVDLDLQQLEVTQLGLQLDLRQLLKEKVQL